MQTLLVVSHCILNAAAKVEQNPEKLEQEFKIRRTLLDLVNAKDVQLIQLPCPVLRIFGTRRWGHVKDQFCYPHFQNECRYMLEPIIEQLEDYAKYPSRFRIIGIVSVEGSTSCGYQLTCRGNWGGELEGNVSSIQETVDSTRMTNEPGVFMEVLFDMLQKHKIDLPILSMDQAAECMKLID